MVRECLVVGGVLRDYASLALSHGDVDLLDRYTAAFLTVVTERLHDHPLSLRFTGDGFAAAYGSTAGNRALVRNLVASCMVTQCAYREMVHELSTENGLGSVASHGSLPVLGLGVTAGQVIMPSTTDTQGEASPFLAGPTVNLALQLAEEASRTDWPSHILIDRVTLPADEISEWLDVEDFPHIFAPPWAPTEQRTGEAIDEGAMHREFDRRMHVMDMFELRRDFYERVVKPNSIGPVLRIELREDPEGVEAEVTFEPRNFRGPLDPGKGIELAIFGVGDDSVEEIDSLRKSTPSYTALRARVPNQLGNRPMVLAIALQPVDDGQIPPSEGKTARQWLGDVEQLVHHTRSSGKGMCILYSRY